MTGNSAIGLLSRAALVRAMLTDGPDSYVAGSMDREFKRVAPDRPLTEVLPMVSSPGSCVLVLDQDDKLVGMLTSENLSEFILLRQATMAQARRT
jgi:CBS domain-containing protein